jgi:peroxiredoxin
MRATEYLGPAQEAFLRQLIRAETTSRDIKGLATVALGELLSKKHDSIERITRRRTNGDEFMEFVTRRQSAEWNRDLVAENSAKFKGEAIQLLRDAVDHYADISVKESSPGFRNVTKLGDKARKSLHALEYLSIGGEAPDIVGKDLEGKALNLRAYRGRIVVLSFWFTGCGPCMGLIPQEQALIATYKDRQFALLSICTDANADMGRATAEKHGINWPCWFDGSDGPIANNYNVLSWPTIYVLDDEGRIAAKNCRGKELDAQVEALMLGK